jgi:16S rRNA (uracil1498-N3)-methyltransferase
MAYLPRIFLKHSATIILQDTLEITEQAAYLSQVLRLKPGDPLDVVASGQCYRATWVAGNAKRGVVTVQQCHPLPLDTLPNMVVAVSLLPDERWRWLLQKTTELGVSTIIPVLSQFSKIKCTDPVAKQQRWQAVVEAAACQSEGLFIPTVTLPQTVEQLVQSTSYNHNILLYERHASRKPLVSLVQSIQPSESVLLAVGPEGGWSNAEKQLFLSYGFALASLGQRILRSETAAIAALSVVAGCSNPDNQVC